MKYCIANIFVLSINASPTSTSFANASKLTSNSQMRALRRPSASFWHFKGVARLHPPSLPKFYDFRKTCSNQIDVFVDDSARGHKECVRWRNSCEIDFSNEVTVTLGAEFNSFNTGELKIGWRLTGGIVWVRRLTLCIGLVRREFVQVGKHRFILCFANPA